MTRMGVAGSLGIIGIAAILAAPPAPAQDSPPVRVRGTIERVDGPGFVVKTRDGSELKVALADNAMIVALVKASVADIKPGAFVGITGMPQPDGSQRAVEVHIFPEAMRGTGEGHYAWDLRPQSTMTNGNIEESVAGSDGQTLRIKYKDGEKKITVTRRPTSSSRCPATRASSSRGRRSSSRRRASSPMERWWRRA